jgi:imidazole glycerol phosphate synthase subunit HisF
MNTIKSPQEKVSSVQQLENDGQCEMVTKCAPEYGNDCYVVTVDSR